MLSDINTTRTAAAASLATLAALNDAAAQTLAPIGPKSTGSPGPGPFAGGNVRFDRTGVTGRANFGNFGCKVFKEDVLTPDWAVANVHFQRDMNTGVKVRMPDGKEVRFWSFTDPIRKIGGSNPLPSPLIRVQEGDLVHVRLRTSKGQHTIHHHGIEPTTMNDGVGHVSFETSGVYTYQWQPRHAGTFFYHCHVNTVTHFEMGLYGLLIVDPLPENGLVKAYHNGPSYDVEMAWVLDDVDPRWHLLTQEDADIGLCGTDSGLDYFQPKYFLINGTPTRPKVPTNAHRIAASPGQKILIRLLNASYSILAVKIGGLHGNVISVDGHSLDKSWNSWMPIAADSTFFMPSAQRYDILIDTDSAENKGKRGTFPVNFEFQEWVTRKPHNLGDPVYEGKSYTTITV